MEEGENKSNSDIPNSNDDNVNHGNGTVEETDSHKIDDGHAQEEEKAEEPQVKKQRCKMDGPAGDCDGEGQEKSIDRLIEAELEELGDKNKVHLLDLFALPIFDATVKMIFLTVSLLLLFICLYSYSSSSYTAHSSWHSCPLISSSLWSFFFFFVFLSACCWFCLCRDAFSSLTQVVMESYLFKCERNMEALAPKT